MLTVKVLILHGPNLDLLGHRQPHLYGRQTLAEIDARLQALGAELSATVTCRQSNREGDLIEWLHEALPAERGGTGAFDAVVLNPAGLGHTSVALADAVEAAVEAGVPVVEVHLTNVHAREPERHRLRSGAKANGVIAGLGEESYTLGLRAALHLAQSP